MAKIYFLINKLQNDENGAALTEYLVLLGLVVGGLAAVIGGFSSAISGSFGGWTTTVGGLPTT